MPRPPDIPPTLTHEDGPMEGSLKTHPACGMLSFSRCSGGPGTLFGSEINHDHYIQMTLCPGEAGTSTRWHSTQRRPTHEPRHV